MIKELSLEISQRLHELYATNFELFNNLVFKVINTSWAIKCRTIPNFEARLNREHWCVWKGKHKNLIFYCLYNDEDLIKMVDVGSVIES